LYHLCSAWRKTQYEKVKNGNGGRHPQDISAKGALEADSHHVQNQRQLQRSEHKLGVSDRTGSNRSTQGWKRKPRLFDYGFRFDIAQELERSKPIASDVQRRK